MISQFDTRTDTVVLIFSTLAVLIAATLSMATISTNHNSMATDSPDASERAEAAANAGVEAARWHIECHGRTKAGGLTPKFYVNGAVYNVEWDNVDMIDSTVMVRSLGEFSWGDDTRNEVLVESRIKIEFLPTHKQEILKDYYSGR
ncbi:MAG: hypothetical protein JSU85_04780 [Candidatus Zixiibacteriota bacterium]|nr:MAG: hypothetical protein JSU85_15775 [candidate division Zixibacteria bacterium]UCE67333.1 MAG: hypothetical protein JSU85_04780 [candidate division Zixibacteria bacterium]